MGHLATIMQADYGLTLGPGLGRPNVLNTSNASRAHQQPYETFARRSMKPDLPHDADSYYVAKGLERVPLTREEKIEIATARDVEFAAISMGRSGLSAAAEGARKSAETRRRILVAHGFEPGTEIVRAGDEIDLAIWTRTKG